MNSFKSQFNSLIFKILILLSIGIYFNISKVTAQKNIDTNYVNILYDSTKVYYINGNYNRAINDLNKILLLKSKISKDTKPEYFKVYNRLGLVHKRKGDLQKAIDLYKKALENTDDKYVLSLINDNIANVYTLTGDYSKAIYYYENTLSILLESDNEKKYSRIANNYHNQGYVYYKLGEYSLAEDYYLKSIQIAEEYQISGIGETYYNCGLIYQNLDSLDKANLYFEKAIESYIMEFNENHYMTAMAYVNYAVFLSETDDFSKSEFFYQKAYGILINTLGKKHPYTSLCLFNNGELYYKEKNYSKALNYYQKSLISKIYNFNDSSIFNNPSQETIPDMDLLDILKGKSNALLKLSQIENKETNLKSALSTLELSVKFIEQLRMGYLYEDSKLVLAEKEHETYMAIIEIAYELLNITGNKDYSNIAFKYSERSKYAILRESINEENAKNIASIPDSIQKYEQEIKEQIGITRLSLANENKREHPDSIKLTELKEKLFELRLSQEKLFKELEQNYPKFYLRKYDNKVIEITDLQLNITDKEAILSYELTDSSLYTFVITKNFYVFNKTKIDTSFFSHLKYYEEYLHSEYEVGYVNYRIAAYELYQKLIEPFEDYLEGKNLLIIPDSRMSLISFESLTTKPYKEQVYTDYATEPYLIRDYPIGYAYSATLQMNQKTKKKKWNPKFLGFAPDYKNSRDSLLDMPLGVKSIKNLSWLLSGKSFTNEDATEYNLKVNYSKYGILHFYAHGIENIDNPQFSKMYMSYEKDTLDDGYLHAYEIGELNIQADLVVLASCYSGSGAVNKGEGILSLGRSFINSGASSLVVSLWLAHYEPSIFELKTFYWYLALGKRKDEALRLAKLKYLESANPLDASPRYWSSLVIVGNQDALFKGFVFRKILLLLIIFAVFFLIVKFRKKQNRKKKLNEI
jgi:CHAT domain-containing protein/Tfp pilus assembly protein PilF